MAIERDAPRQVPDRGDIAELGGPDGVERLVRSLMAIMRDGGLSELDLHVGSLAVRLRGQATGTAVAGGPAPSATAGTSAEPEPEPGHVITAPMIGTFYAASSPGASPFVEVGDRIAAGQVVGIIEAMKIMNEIVADQAGEVAAVLAANGQAVEYGSPLVLLAPHGRGA